MEFQVYILADNHTILSGFNNITKIELRMSNKQGKCIVQQKHSNKCQKYQRTQNAHIFICKEETNVRITY